MLAIPTPTACAEVSASTDGSTIIAWARIQYTITRSAVPESHVV